MRLRLPLASFVVLSLLALLPQTAFAQPCSTLLCRSSIPSMARLATPTA